MSGEDVKDRFFRFLRRVMDALGEMGDDEVARIGAMMVANMIVDVARTMHVYMDICERRGMDRCINAVTDLIKEARSEGNEELAHALELVLRKLSE